MKQQRKPKYYLSHPFDNKDEVKKWQEGFEKESGIEFINPFDYNKNAKTREEVYSNADPDKLVSRDIGLICISRGVVCMINGAKSYGTPQEMVYAKLYKKPVYTLVTNGDEKHPWLVVHSTKIFTERKKLEEFLIGLERGKK